MAIDDLKIEIKITCPFFSYEYFTKTDDEIIETTTMLRGLTLKQDFRRHIVMAVRAYFGLSKYHSKRHVPAMLEYAMRLLRIINKSNR